MNLFRNQAATRIFCLITGIIFLNMSFFLAEVSILDLKDKKMVENICKLRLNGGLEEERDGFSGRGDGPTKEFSLFSNESLLRYSAFYLIASKIYQVSEDYYPICQSFRKVFTPPGLLYLIF